MDKDGPRVLDRIPRGREIGRGIGELEDVGTGTKTPDVPSVSEV